MVGWGSNPPTRPPSAPRSTALEPPSAAPDDEDSIIAALRTAFAPGARQTTSALRIDVDLGDDAAVVDDGLAVTVDTLVEGVHWNDRLTPYDVGWKAVAVSASDLAAMGAEPRWMVLALSLPTPDPAWVARFAEGAAAAALRWNIRLIGGDTTRSPADRFVSITMGGRVLERPLRRDQAQPEDDLWTTGTLGLAGAGWRTLHPPPVARRALAHPEPPVAFALALATGGLATAAMDLSDGLARDLPRMCTASGVGADVWSTALPVCDDLGTDAIDHALHGGEDYQLLFTSPREQADALAVLAEAHDIEIARIGRMTEGTGPRLDGADWPIPAFAHFRRGHA